MASAVADLEAGLQAMLNLKPPGVSGSRITSLTTLCVANIQSESVLIQKIFTHFKKAPGTHKLGVLYVVDSVTRKWLEQAKAQGQAVNSSAPDGTYGAGVNRVTELMPVLMNDILQTAPEEQKEKIKKLLDIWEKGQTFPISMLESFKEKLNAPPHSKVSTTPPGSPPAGLLASLQKPMSAPPAAPAQNGQSILDALANIARQNTTAPPSSSSLPAPAASYNVPPPVTGLPQPVSSTMAQPSLQMQNPASYPPSQPAVNLPSSLPFSLPQVTSSMAGASPNMPNNQFPGGPAPAGGALDPNTQQQILLIKALADQGVPFEKIPALIQSMTPGAAGTGATGTAQQGAVPAPNGTYGSGQPSWGAQPPKPDGGRDWYKEGVRSPGRYHGRSRSRSPDRGWGGRGSPRNGRDRTDYGRNSPARGRDEDRRGNDYRTRSPPRRRGQTPPDGEKWTDYDPNIPQGTIKVLSRTLFVGGVTCSEAELRNIFTRFGAVQTCIVNKDKRHAFVKMLTRKDAISAKEGSEDNRGLEIPLRTRWGVGFGPRDCSDYGTGVSIIPINRLTEADRKWMLTAPHGGSGGRPIATGLVVEEPDIEIGAGVSSKAISRRMQTDKGGANGPKSTRNRDDGWGRGRGQEGGDRRPEPNGDENQPAIQGFPFGIGTLPNGMPNFPAGFSFPDPTNGGKWA